MCRVQIIVSIDKIVFPIFTSEFCIDILHIKQLASGIQRKRSCALSIFPETLGGEETSLCRTAAFSSCANPTYGINYMESSLRFLGCVGETASCTLHICLQRLNPQAEINGKSSSQL